MAYQYLLISKEEGIGTITINRPEVRNAMNPEAWQELRAAVQELRRDPDVKVLIITGAGDRAFVAGADVSRFPEVSAIDCLTPTFQQITEEIEQLEKPVIAAINGYALGGGCELAMACDIRVASDRAKLGQPEVNLGIIPGSGGTQRLPRLVGKGKAKELIFTGDIIDAHEAERIGLVNRVVPAAELMAVVREMAKKIMAKGPLAIRLAKAAINLGMETSQAVGQAYERMAQSVIYSTEDKREGVAAFLEKRPPQFKGK